MLSKLARLLDCGLQMPLETTIVLAGITQAAFQIVRVHWCKEEATLCVFGFGGFSSSSWSSMLNQEASRPCKRLRARQS